MADAPSASPPQLDESNDDLPLFSLFEPTEECICDFGDIILNADDGFHPAQKLRVSSCILAMSSKVFKALFSKRFAEGQAGASRSSSEPHEIVVQDLPTPLKHLCQMLHHQTPQKDGVIDLEESELLDIALMADKYDVVEALTIQFEALLGRFITEEATHNDRNLEKLIAASVLLNQKLHFQHFTRDMVMRWTNISASDIEQPCLDVFPADLVSCLRDQQHEARQMFTKQIMELTQNFSEACRVAKREILVHEFVEALVAKRLMPPDFGKHNLRQLLERLDSIDIPIVTPRDVAMPPGSILNIPIEQQHPCDSWGDGWGFRAVDAPTHRTIRQAADAVESLCQGICLICIQGKADLGWHVCNETAMVNGWDNGESDIDLTGEADSWS